MKEIEPEYTFSAFAATAPTTTATRVNLPIQVGRRFVNALGLSLVLAGGDHAGPRDLEQHARPNTPSPAKNPTAIRLASCGR